MKPKTIFFVMVGILAVTISASTAMYLNTSNILRTSRDKFAQKELELLNSYDQLQYLETLEISTNALENSLGSLTSIYPDKKMQPQVIVQLRRLASENNVSIEGNGISFPATEGLPSEKSQLSESEAVGGLVGMPVQLAVSGDFDDTMNFLIGLENFRRLMNVAALDMTVSDSGRLVTNIQIEVLVQQSIKKAKKPTSAGQSNSESNNTTESSQ